MRIDGAKGRWGLSQRGHNSSRLVNLYEESQPKEMAGWIETQRRNLGHGKIMTAACRHFLFLLVTSQLLFCQNHSPRPLKALACMGGRKEGRTVAGSWVGRCRRREGWKSVDSGKAHGAGGDCAGSARAEDIKERAGGSKARWGGSGLDRQ